MLHRFLTTLFGDIYTDSEKWVRYVFAGVFVLCGMMILLSVHLSSILRIVVYSALIFGGIRLFDGSDSTKGVFLKITSYVKSILPDEEEAVTTDSTDTKIDVNGSVAQTAKTSDLDSNDSKIVTNS